MKKSRVLRSPVLKIFILFVLLFFILYFIISFFQIRSIEVIGNNIFLDIDEKRLTKSLLFFPADRIKSEILLENPILESVVIKKKFPHTLVLELTTRYPVAQIKTNAGNYLLSSNGVLLGNVLGYGMLPVLDIPISQNKPGNLVSDEYVRFSLAFLALAQDSVLAQRIRKNDSASVEVEIGDTKILLDITKPVEESIATLQNLISGFRIKGIMPSRIDIRFDKAIVQ